jgi:hypothetical protein
MARQAYRAALVLAAFLAPWLVYIVQAVQADPDAFINGFVWGGVASVAALAGFAMSFKTSAVERLGRFAQGLVPVVIGWCTIFFWV